MKRFHWQLFALSTLSFSVSIENFGFTVSTPFFFLLKCMLIIHVLRWTEILQCGSAESKTALFFLLAKKLFWAGKTDFRSSRC